MFKRELTDIAKNIHHRFFAGLLTAVLLRRRHELDAAEAVLRQDYEAAGEKLVLYSVRHGYVHRAHLVA